MDNELAEFIGIFLGDGSLNVRSWKNSYEFKIVGNIHDEIPYFQEHVSLIASRVIGREIGVKILDSGRSVGLYFCSKKFALYLKRMGIDEGPKAATARIPDCIMRKDGLSIACMRGLFDTDGCFTLKKGGSYPVVTFTSKSRNLIEQVRIILDRKEIQHCVSFDVRYFDPRRGKEYSKHYLSINGRKRIRKWFALVGSSNPKILNKYEKFKRNSGEWI